MTERAQNLLTDFQAKGWKAERLYERLFELAENTDELFSFLEEYVKRYPESSTLFNDGLSYITRKHFAELIKLSLQIIQTNKNENAESVIEYAGLQFPELLHPYLEQISELNLKNRNYYLDYAWRRLDKNAIQYFKDKLSDKEAETNENQLFFIFRTLLQTREPETVKYAFAYALNNKFFGRPDLETWLTIQLEEVGYTKQGNTIKTYCPNKTRHFIFPDNYFLNSGPVYLRKNQHPSWKLKPTDTTTYKLGGFLDDNESNPFFHLITFHQIPTGLYITGLSQLVLGAHINELHEAGMLFYQHDAAGVPQKLNVEEAVEPEVYNRSPIVETQIAFADTPARWEFQSWGHSNGRENLFRLGGEPTWIQGGEVPTCPVCQEKMDFLLQLDSNLPTEEDDELLFGSNGICYVFWCNKSKVSSYMIECT